MGNNTVWLLMTEEDGAPTLVQVYETEERASADHRLLNKWGNFRSYSIIEEPVVLG